MKNMKDLDNLSIQMDQNMKEIENREESMEKEYGLEVMEGVIKVIF